MGSERADGELLSSWTAGDEAAGQLLVKRHYRAVFRFLYGKVPEDVAADLTQATFETLCTNQEKFRGESALRTYLFGIARWKLTNHFRRYHRHRAEFDPAEHSSMVPVMARSLSSVFAEQERSQLVMQALEALPIDDRIVLELRDYEGFSGVQIAQVLEVPAPTVRGRIHRARKRLKAGVEKLQRGDRMFDDGKLESHLHAIHRALRAQPED